MHLEKVFPTTKHPDRNCSLWPTTGVRQSVWSWTQLLCYSQKKKEWKLHVFMMKNFASFHLTAKSVSGQCEQSCEKSHVKNWKYGISEVKLWGLLEMKSKINKTGRLWWAGAGGRQARAFCCRHWGTARTFLSNKFYNPLMGSSRFVPVRPNAVYTKTKSKQGKQRH